MLKLYFDIHSEAIESKEDLLDATREISEKQFKPKNEDSIGNDEPGMCHY